MLTLCWAALIAINLNLTGVEAAGTESEPPIGQAQLSVLCWNIHDLRLVSKHRKERMRQIAEEIKRRDPDIVCLQEAFVKSDRIIILEGLKGTRLKYSNYFRSGLVGSGLLTLSAFPVQDVKFHRFTRNGKWYKPWHGDWWAGKGISMVRIAFNKSATIAVYNCHLHAEYREPREYLADRREQVREVAAFVEKTGFETENGVLAGDFNCTSADEEFGGLKAIHGRSDTLTSSNAIDHIFWMRRTNREMMVQSKEVFEGTVEVRGSAVELSDHPAYLVRLKIGY